jgi:hypothetical protein
MGEMDYPVSPGSIKIEDALGNFLPHKGAFKISRGDVS